MNRPGFWVGLHRDKRLRVDILRRYPTRLVCRVVEPGEFQLRVGPSSRDEVLLDAVFTVKA